ncbi:MAG: UbiA family prenyltransferase [Bacteroidales bacterium]|nr:UbiA family prenyltransferase [Bacteroidales bacterium]
MNLKHIWRLIRGNNLIFIALTMYLFKYVVIRDQLLINGVFYSENAEHTAEILFLLIVLGAVFIAAGGYVINDINDIATDKINKPEKVLVEKVIPKKSAMQLYHFLNIMGLLISGIAFFILGKITLITIPLLASMMLYLYAVKHKCNGLLGNLFIAFSTSLLVVLVWLFEYYRLIIGGADYQLNDIGFQTILIGYILFSFMLTLLREWAKDRQDLAGDLKSGCRHFMAKRTEKASSLILLVGSTLFILFLAVWQYFLFQNLDGHIVFASNFVSINVVALIYVIPLAYKAKTKEDFGRLSSLFKLLMFAGILSMSLLLIN